MIIRRTAIADPLTLPLTLAEAKKHLRVDLAEDDELITDYIRTACDLIGDQTWSSVYRQTWELVLPCFPGDSASSDGLPWVRGRPLAFRVPRGPVVTIDEIRYVDGAGDAQIVDSADYQTSRGVDCFIVAPVAGGSWPATQSDAIEPVVVEFTAGYSGAAGFEFPSQIKQAVRMLVAHWYENREATLVGTISKELEFSIAQLCRNVSLWRFNR